MAELFLGRTTGRGGYEKEVAIKRILPHMASDEGSIQMFFDEARISARLIHTNIAQIFDLGVSDGSPFIAMEYVHGVSLNEIMIRLDQQGRLAAPSLSAYVVEKICAALAHAHSRRDDEGLPLDIVHRDVSPSNVLCSYDGEVKLIDFGIAKAARRLQHTRTGYLKGKLAYMSPEQVRGLPVDHRSDIFAAGTLLYTLLAGVHPFRSDTDTGTLERVRLAAAPPPRTVVPDIPAALDAACVRALSLETEDRFADAGQMARTLEDYRSEHRFSRDQLAQWMKDNFAQELGRSADLLREAERGTTTDHTPSDGMAATLSLEENQDETSIFAHYPPTSDPLTDTLAGPGAGRAEEAAPDSPGRPATVPVQRKRGRVVAFALGAAALALAGSLIYLMARAPGAPVVDSISVADEPRQLPVPAAAPSRRHSPVDARAHVPDRFAPDTSTKAPDSGVDSAAPAEQPGTTVKIKRKPGRKIGRRDIRRRRWRQRRGRKKKRILRAPPTSSPKGKKPPPTKPGVAPLPYPNL